MRRPVALVAALVALAGTMQAQELRLSPGWACAGDSVVVSWAGARAGVFELGAQLDGASAARQLLATSDGRLAHLLRGTTAFRLASTDGAWSRVDTVEAHPAEMTHELRRSASCSGRLSLTSMAIPPARASDRIRPRSVTNRGATAVWIVHRGHSARLAPGETTEVFNTLPFSGDWGVIVDSGDFNRACPAGAVPPPDIAVIIITSCASR